MLESGKAYSRKQIHDLLGGGTQDYIPHQDGKVVCGCFGRKLNPAAPVVILAGNGPRDYHWAKVFCHPWDGGAP